MIKLKNKIRYLKPQEIDLIISLVHDKVQYHFINELNNRLINDLIDDGLSIEFFIEKKENNKVKDEFSALYFDNDGVSISVYITVNQMGDLYDMDIWKADGTPIIKYPQGRGEAIFSGEVTAAKPPAKLD